MTKALSIFLYLFVYVLKVIKRLQIHWTRKQGSNNDYKTKTCVETGSSFDYKIVALCL